MGIEPAIIVPTTEAYAGAAVLGRRGARSDWTTFLTAASFVGFVLLVQGLNSRAYVGYHGLVHTAITQRILAGEMPPTNPYAAGTPLPYYWTYHVVLAGVARLLQGSPLCAAQFVNIAAILALVALFGSLGRALLGGARYGYAALGLALLGANPGGPLILAYRVVTGAASLSMDAFSRSPLHPLLRASMLNHDVRWGPNFLFFLQPSSRTIGFVLAVVAAVMVCRLWREWRWSRAVGLALAVAGAGSMNPVIGVGAGAALAAGALAAGRLFRTENNRWLRRQIAIIATIAAGLVIALPTYTQLLNGNLLGLPIETTLTRILWKGLNVTLLSCVLITLCALAMRRRLLRYPELTVLWVAAIFSFLLSVVGHVPGGREHSFFNLGMFFLAVPAAAALVRPPGAPSVAPRPERRLGLGVAAALLPASLTFAAATVYRGPMPLQEQNGVIARFGGDDREALYRWIRAHTSPNAILVTDPRDEPWTHFYGNESEVPALTNRTLFVDRPGWILPANPQFELRRTIAAKLFDNQALSVDELSILIGQGGPLYLLSQAGDGKASPADQPPVFEVGDYRVRRWRPDPATQRPLVADLVTAP